MYWLFMSFLGIEGPRESFFIIRKEDENSLSNSDRDVDICKISRIGTGRLVPSPMYPPHCHP